MHEGRADDSTATLLTDGTVLIAGGEGGTAEIYDPATGQFSVAPSMTVGRRAPTATRINDGTVLVAGGFDGSAGMTSAELYDPQTQSWSATGSMHDGRFSHTATLLDDGRVLVVAGWTTETAFLDSAEIYDPADGRWSSAGSIDGPRGQQSAVRLSDGRVLVAGGEDGTAALGSAELFDPDSTSWTAVADMSHARSYAGAVLLADGKVLVAGGGSGNGRLSSAELFDPATSTWRPVTDLTEPRSQLGTVRLADGRVLAIGGNETHNPTAEIYDPGSSQWAPTGNMTTWRASPMAVVLTNGKVLVAGGFADDSATSELFDETSGEAVATLPPWFSRCELGCQGPVEDATFTSTGFFPGMQMAVNGSWFNTADNPQELQFEQGENVLRFWRNPGASSPTGELLSEIPLTVAGLVEWLTTNPNISASEVEPTTVGGHIAANTLTVTISPANVNVDPECPSDVRSCLRVLWIARGHDFAIGYGEAVRLYLVTRQYLSGDRDTIVVSLDAPNSEQLAQLTTLVAPILASLRFP